MAQNLFMTSMYFFVPINKVNKLMLHRRAGTWYPIECQAIFHDVSAECIYTELSYYNQPFYYNAVIGGVKDRKVPLKVYLLHYIPSKTERIGSCFYIVVGTGIDKSFINSDGQVDACTAQDIVMLKRAFYSESNRIIEKGGLYYPQNDPMIFHREWLERIVHDFDLESDDNIAFDASITEVRAVANTQPFVLSTSGNINDAFNHNYYDAKSDTYDKVLNGIDANRFAYGVSEGNENYAKLPDDIITQFLAHSYSNNDTERIFSNPNKLTFFCTHYPFVNLQEEKNCLLRMNIEDIDARMVYELCHSLFLKKELRKIQSKINSENKPGEVKIANDRLNQIVKIRLFNMNEADNRLKILFSGLGVSNEYDETKCDVENYLRNKQFSYSKRQNRISRAWGFASIASTVLTALLFNDSIFKWLTETNVTINQEKYPALVGALLLTTSIMYFIWIQYSAITNKLPSWIDIKKKWKRITIKLNTIRK